MGKIITLCISYEANCILKWFHQIDGTVVVEAEEITVYISWLKRLGACAKVHCILLSRDMDVGFM